MYLGVNRNKRSIVLDLKKKKSKQVLWKLIKKSDVFIVDFTKEPENSRSSFPKGSKILIPPLKIESFAEPDYDPIRPGPCPRH